METIPKEMNVLIKESAMQSYKYTTIPVPSPKDNEVLMKVAYVAICGSDIPLYLWNETGQKIATLPFIPGHECSGEIVQVGSKVTQFKVGDRICAETHLPCEKCFLCKRDQKGICSSMGLFGHGVKTFSGGCAQYTTVPENAVYKLQSNISLRLASILEPFGVAHNACEELPIKGDSVLILGAGPIGLFAVAIAKEMGATKIIITDIVEKRLQIGKDVGATVLLNTKDWSIEDLHKRILQETDGDGVGNVIECTGAPPMVNGCFKMLRKGGSAMLVGLPKAPLHVENVLADFLFKAITVKTLHGRKIFHTWIEAEKLMNKINLEPIITHEFVLSDYENAFKVLLNGEACKIILQCK